MSQKLRKRDQKLRKRDRFKRAVKSGGKKVASFAKSRIVRRFIPLFGLIAIITPGKALAFSIPEILGLDGPKGKNATFIAAEFAGIREVTRQGVGAIIDPNLRSAVSSAGSIAAVVGGISCGVGSAFCSGMGWEQKAMICLHGVGVCSGVASGLHDADPANPVTAAGSVASEVVGKMSV